MSSVVISGDVSGTVSLTAPSAAGSTVLTLPATTGTVVTDNSTASLTNKTINGSNNTLTNVPASALTGTVGATNGGTGIATYATGDILYASATNTLSKLAVGTNGYILTLSGGIPAWSAPPATGVTVNTTTITGGTTGRILYDNSGTVGELATVPVSSGGSGATTLTGILKGNGTSAFTAATAGTDYVAPATATSFTATQTFATVANPSIITPNIFEVANYVSSGATGTINIDVLVSSIVYYTVDATSSFVLNIRGSSTTSLNSVLAAPNGGTPNLGQSVTVVFINKNGGAGATGYYPTAITVDGGTPTLKWLNATVTAGNSGIDMYSIAITKTANATFTVFASQSKFV